jgi:segregation and condensation protein A
MSTAGKDYRVKLDLFEGPLDLLLYLIKKNEIDIYNIPVSMISSQYIDYLNLMKDLNLDVAGEFVHMAASLIHLKSQMLVPTPLPSDEEGEDKDPRADLVKQLLEYQRYKEAAEELLDRNILNRDVFKRIDAARDLERPKSDKKELVEISIFSLIDTFSKILTKIPEDFPQEIYFERLTIRERISEIAEIVSSNETRTVRFTELFSDAKTKSSIIVTFLALLEMIRMNLVRALQAKDYSDILISATELITDNSIWEYDDAEQNTN